jgi:hypothetical protein
MSKATSDFQRPGIANAPWIRQNHLELPKSEDQRWQIFTLALDLQPNFDQTLFSRSNLPAHLILCHESSGISRFLKIRRDPRIPLYYLRHRKTSDHTAVGTHSRLISQLRSYAQSQIVASETFAGGLGGKRTALSWLANGAIKYMNRFPERERPMHNGLSKAS